MLLPSLLSSSIGLLLVAHSTHANPKSRPYVPFRTSPYEHSHLDHNLTLSDTRKSRLKNYNQKTQDAEKCPLQFTLGLSRRSHMAPQHSSSSLAIVQPPVLYPIHPSRGPGRQVLHTTQYEHLDLLSPSRIPLDAVIQEGLVQQEDFPLLFESSSFLTSPLIHDVNGDGIADAILADYDGGLYFVGLGGDKRYFEKAQVPRMYLRRGWVECRLNETIHGELPVVEEEERVYDPFHSHFEYGSDRHVEDKAVLQGVTANVLDRKQEDLLALDDRRSRRITREKPPKEEEEVAEDGQVVKEGDGAQVKDEEESVHRRLEQIEGDESKSQGQEEVKDLSEGQQVDVDTPGEESAGGEGKESDPESEQREAIQEDEPKDLSAQDDWEAVRGGEGQGNGWGDDEYGENWGDDEAGPTDDHRNGGMEDDYGAYDDYHYGGHYHRNEVLDEYYDDKHYIRIPPHLLCPPVLMETPKLYSQNPDESRAALFVAVSYYMDEDEYEGFFSYKRFDNIDIGDESEVERGSYVASALMIYELDSTARWGRQEHLDLSADPTAPQNATLVGSYPIVAHDEKMGAFAMSPPVLADIDGDGSIEVLIGTSMGIVYCFDANHMFKKDGWPVQMKSAIETRMLVEDVVGDTNLEIFISDVEGNLVCLNHAGAVIWHRDLGSSIGSDVVSSSPMSLGDVNGDGILDLVLVSRSKNTPAGEPVVIFAFNAATGDDLPNFPVSLEPKVAGKESGSVLPQPLLVDLHSDQTQWESYLLRNGARATHENVAKSKAPHGGSALGLHIVQPVGSDLFIVEAGSGCIQKIDVGDEVAAMVQADDVHGTNRLDLVVSTVSGNIVTLESPAVPYHPLNVWSNGDIRGRMNSFAQGFSASQGIFVHDSSRQYRDIFGVYLPVTFQIFDNRPNIEKEPNRRIYKVEMRDGTSSERPLFRKEYNATGTYTERFYVPYGPGYYSISVVMKTSHGLVYEDTFHLGYNVHYMDGFGILLWLPLLLAAIPILLCGKKKITWDDEDFDSNERGGSGQGILGRALS